MSRISWIPYIRSHNNVKIEFLNLTPQMIKIDSILLHLAKACRYNGMLDGWYSNAEHSILCALQAEREVVKKYALIHDFGESITNDVPGPVKRQCSDYTKLCDEVQDYMYFHFMGSSIVPPEVKEIDNRMYATEQHYLRKAPDEDLNGLKPYDNVKFYQWEWREAYKCIKLYFHTLFPEYRDAV